MNGRKRPTPAFRVAGGVKSKGRVAQIPFCHCEPRPLRIVMVGVWQSHYIS